MTAFVHELSVTQNHIDLAQSPDASECPIWHALSEDFPERRVSVSNIFASVGDVWTALEGEAHRFTIAYDRGDPVCPSTFVLTFRVPRPYPDAHLHP